MQLLKMIPSPKVSSKLYCVPVEIKSTQKQPSCEKMVRPLKSLGEKSCEIKGGGQKMAAMMLMLIMPPFISQLFTQAIEGCDTLFSQLEWPLLLEHQEVNRCRVPRVELFT